MGENINTLKNLLQDVAIIQKKYDEHPDKNGEKFNVFSVMAMEHSEVNTHSAIIGELLNPNGSHRQGSVFLQLFVKEIKDTFGSNIDLVDFNTLVNDKICEKTISLEIDWKNVSGGRIDLIVEDHEKILIIENKLYAIDQPLQLIRYNNYAKTKKKVYNILYLTLFGKKLKEEEKGLDEIMGYNHNYTDKNKYDELVKKNGNNLNIHHCLYYPISFETHIKNWVEKCLQEPELKPLLKATLEQYLALIKKITFQTMSEEMKKEIVDSILMEPIKSENVISKNEIFDKSKNVRSAFAIVESIENLKKQLYYEIIDKLKKKIGLEEINGFEYIEVDDINDDPEYCGLYFNFGGFKKNTIGLFFGNKNYNSFSENVFFGFRKREGLEDMAKKFQNKFGFISTDFWVYKNSKFNNWGDSAEIWENVAKGEEGEVFTEIISVIKEIMVIDESPN
ncbi:MAG: PD-(D/E)XK nuclease family protein [Flavobacterium sp.]|nr:PD-(D/E)XK nuclease family protein [Flavobacterium sp.]